MNYFDFFGIKPEYIIDELILKKKFLEYSRLYHPDHFALKPTEDQESAEEQSAFNNKAFKVLSQPESRLKYILELKHVIQDEEIYTLDQDFLMEMLDLNDLIEEDASAATAQLKQLEESLYTDILPVLQTYDHIEIIDSDLKRLKDYHYKKRYILRIRENLNKFAS